MDMLQEVDLVAVVCAVSEGLKTEPWEIMLQSCKTYGQDVWRKSTVCSVALIQVSRLYMKRIVRIHGWWVCNIERVQRQLVEGSFVSSFS